MCTRVYIIHVCGYARHMCGWQRTTFSGGPHFRLCLKQSLDGAGFLQVIPALLLVEVRGLLTKGGFCSEVANVPEVANGDPWTEKGGRPTDSSVVL